MDAKVQLQEVRDRLAQLDPNNRDHLVEIAKLKAKETELLNQAVQEEAAQVRIQDATEQAAYFLDNLVIEGLTMRELCVAEPQYQMLRIAVQNQIINQAEEFGKQIIQIQTEENVQQSRIKQQLEELQAKYEEDTNQLNAQLAQAHRETNDYIGKLKNATDEIDRLNSQVDDLRKEIAVGARNAYKVTDMEQTQQLKQLADQIKASRIHVYDVEPDNAINPRNYTAKRADNGDTVTYNWTQAKNYIEIKDPNEVEQFRQQFANQEVVSDSPLGNEKAVDVTPEDTFPVVPTAEDPFIPGEIQVAIPTPELGGQGQTVEERLSALEAHVFGYVKQAVA